jgi:hypothetical protein
MARWNQQDKFRIAERRKTVASLYLQGKFQAEIAQEARRSETKWHSSPATTHLRSLTRSCSRFALVGPRRGVRVKVGQLPHPGERSRLGTPWAKLPPKPVGWPGPLGPIGWALETADKCQR